jgi:hypothetical protein
MSRSRKTIDHDTIRRWADERSGKPSMVKAAKEAEGGILRINFPGYSGKESLEEISWDEFFKIFDEKNLMFVYQRKTKGHKSNFNKIISRDQSI